MDADVKRCPKCVHSERLNAKYCSKCGFWFYKPERALEYKQFVRAIISTKKFRQILRAFTLDLTATQIAALTNLNRNTVNRYLTFIR